jgi:trigger factor
VKSTVENLSPTRVRLAVEVPFGELQPGVDAAYKKIASSVRVPGFRPGKVPARVIDQRVGRSAVVEEAVNNALPGIYTEAAREHELKPLGQPEIDVTNLEDGVSLSFTAEVDVRPEIDLPELAGLAVTVDDVEVSEADVDEQLTALRERFGTLKGIERAIQSGDYVSLDLSATVDGKQVEEGSAKGLSYEVGSGDLIDGLDDALLDKNAGDTATFPTTLQQGEQAGAQAQITAVVNSAKEKELPDVDDEFARMASEFDTVEQLKDDLRSRLSKGKAFEQGAQARDKVLEKLLEAVEFPLPESAVAAEIEYREHEIVHSLGHDDAVFERYLTLQGKSREEFTADLREGAEKAVRAQFVLDALADKTEVQIGDGELTEYLVRQAARLQMPAQQFANQLVQGGNLPALVADVRRNKALANLLETAVITDESGNAVDLSQLTPAAMADILDADGADDDDFEGAGVGDDAAQNSDIEPADAE